MAAATEEQLDWERRQRPRAGAAAIVAGVFTLAGNLYPATFTGEFPTEPTLRSLAIAAQGRESTVKIEQALFYNDHATELIATAFLTAVGSLCIALLLRMLGRAARVRTPGPEELAPGERRRMDLSGPARYLALVGPVLLAVAQLIYHVSLQLDVGSFADSAQRTESAARDALEGNATVAGLFIQPIGSLLIGFAMVVICLNAMRVGLLTRFMGVLGIIVGVLFVIPIGSQIPIVPAFWMIALGAMLLGVGPARPPAWDSGKPEPWPSQQEIREQRIAAAEARRGGGKAKGEPSARPEPAAVGSSNDAEPSPSASSKKRKRKRR